ncbi:hypothetical protein WJX73_001481 [Symbiochloris irregularis]|uniref:Pirin n=1 Tax=Symbiochloris irregularis TaxID=706552 RepID=A0AAW1NY57_9CHLO
MPNTFRHRLLTTATVACFAVSGRLLPNAKPNALLVTARPGSQARFYHSPRFTTFSTAQSAMASLDLRSVEKVVQGQKMMEGAGKMEHRDSCGNQGLIEDGGVQWMTAGRGIIHSEMPVVTQGDLWGFQLWINLPKKDKMTPPQYQDYQSAEIPVVDTKDSRVRVMAGKAQGATGPIFMRNPGMLLDVTVKPGGTFEQQIPAEFNAFAYVCDGSGKLSGTAAKAEQTLVLGPGDRIQATTSAEAGFRFLLAAGKPIGEPIVQHGPFVMNTQDEIMQAFDDYQRGRLQNPGDNPWRATPSSQPVAA